MVHRPVGCVVSGGQTGVDRAALDAAVQLGVEYAGWCPRGGWAEDLPTPPGLLAVYPGLRETPSEDPAERTRRNVRDSAGTLVLLPDGVESPGTELTVALAAELGRPVLTVAPGEVGRVVEWLSEEGVGWALNVAGPRESEAPGVYAEALVDLRRLLAGG